MPPELIVYGDDRSSRILSWATRNPKVFSDLFEKLSSEVTNGGRDIRMCLCQSQMYMPMEAEGRAAPTEAVDRLMSGLTLHELDSMGIRYR